MLNLSAIFSQGIVLAAAAGVGLSAALVALCSFCQCCCAERRQPAPQPVRRMSDVECEVITALMRAA
jgi:hypothetical protein